MKVTIEIELEDKDYPMYCTRVNALLRAILDDPYFNTGSVHNGWTLKSEHGTVTVTYKEPK